MQNTVKSLLISTLAIMAVCSCNKEMTPMNKSTVTIDFFTPDIISKADSPYSEEDVINNVKLFIDQVDQTTGVTTRFAEYYTETGNITVDLVFPNDASYEYTFRAYANFGDIKDIPDIIEFSECFDNGMKMHAEETVYENMVRSGYIQILMKRYVGKVTVNSISLFWDQEFDKPLEINAIYLSNVGKDNSSTSESHYNPEGVINGSNMDSYLHEVIENVSIQYGDKYNCQHHFYGFNGYTSNNPTAIIIETTYEGNKMYYQIDVDFNENHYMIYDFVIIGAGTDVPYGSKVDMKSSIVSKTSIISVEGWNTDKEKLYSEEITYGNTDITIGTEWD